MIPNEMLTQIDWLSVEDKYKFVDDLLVLELINMIVVGLSSYNFKQHVASDIGINQLYLPAEHIQSETYMNNISEWTEKNKMKLNEKKSQVMIVSETKNYQFSTRIHVDNALLETITEIRWLSSHQILPGIETQSI